ncbi:hypothetical protein E1I18_02425 [Mycoplasmopsis mucosicanis]|uniref:F0F1 ATP synthase subunit gamma n=1 Tax=Mycoplasmopsis mucosicanis TaxID=458208 RepID=A0A507SKP4_9BACT|nr:hypothetical protein [Mycoplasmopsis mucosicanis]TQC51516.1 hypothetical protein E1I18_02425 [Mycoplasmopsis mucosicanis]
MHLVKLLEKRKKLDFIHKRVLNNKNILLINIIKLTQNLKYFSKKALETRNLITEVNKYYKVSNWIIDSQQTSLLKKIFNKKSNTKKSFELFVYLTDEQKYGTDSYSRYERTLLEEAQNKSMHFITIGSRAYDFCKKNNFKIIKHFQSWSIDYQFILNFAELIKQAYIIDQYNKVNFVINSNKMHNHYFTILPLKLFNLQKLVGNNIEFDTKSISKVKIFPNIKDFYNNIVEQFILFSLQALFVESSFYQAKIGLITSNKINSELEESLLKLNKKIITAKREKEIEEINIITRKKESILDLRRDNG